MRRMLASLIAVIAGMALVAPGSVPAAGKEAEIVASATEVLDEIFSIPEKGIPPKLLRDARGVAIVPGVIKVGLIVGGRHGRGILLVRDGKGRFGDPVFVSLTGGSLGWQIGAQSTDVVLVFKSGKSVDGILKGKFTLGADAGVAAGPVGRRAEAATDAQLSAEIYSYSRSRGLFAGISLEGSALQIDADANGVYYGKEGVTPGEIIGGKGVRSPEGVRKVKMLLEKHVDSAKD